MIESGNESGAFRLVCAGGDAACSTLELAVSAPLDHESTPDYRLVVAAVDGGMPPRTGHVTVHVTVADSNDNRPVFDQPSYTAAVREDAHVGTCVRATRCSAQPHASPPAPLARQRLPHTHTHTRLTAVCLELGQLSLASLRGRLIEYQLRLG